MSFFEKKKELWKFLLRLVPLTLLFGYFWFAFLQVRYPVLIRPVASFFLELVGVDDWLLYIVLEHFTNLVPFASLVLASPGLVSNWKKTLTALFGGLAIIIAGHLLLSWVVFELNEAYGLSRAFYRVVVPLLLLNDTLPLLLWVAFYPRLPGRLLGLRIFGDQKIAK
ncbi:MAG: hypothetical protein DRP45_07460 [Candidatus Zixiibacteriota bacterium]|nr:MAG: hypothetical protein DRP45_07460 [candidate division Zixibacteria bacterium]